MDPLALSATDLRRKLLSGEISSAELLDLTLQRIEAVNPAVNAVVAIEADQARQAAALSDRRIAAGEARALEGLVITVKDSFDTAGMRSTAGAPPYRARVPETDAAAVARLEACGRGDRREIERAGLHGRFPGL